MTSIGIYMDHVKNNRPHVVVHTLFENNEVGTGSLRRWTPNINRERRSLKKWSEPNTEDSYRDRIYIGI